MPTGKQGGSNREPISPGKFWLSSALVIIVVGILMAWAWLPLRPEEPVDQGKTLSEWIKAYSESAGDSEEEKKAEAAFQKIGTNVVPALLRMIQTPDSSFRTMLKALMRQQSFFQSNFEDARDIRYRASYGFLIFAEDAKGAVPELVTLVKRGIGTAGREEAIVALGHIGPAAKAAVPALLTIVPDTKDPVRDDAIYTLGCIHSSPESAVPVLASCLRDSDGRVRYSAARSLSKFGEAAKSSTPALIKLLADPSPQVRQEVTNFLKLIDPATATAAGIK
jgi:HEAT repeat protein